MPSLEKEAVRQGKHTPGRFGCEHKSRILVAIYQLVPSLLTFSWTSLTCKWRKKQPLYSFITLLLLLLYLHLIIKKSISSSFTGKV